MHIRNDNINKLIANLQSDSKKLLCIGAGETLLDACSRYEYLHFSGYIMAVFDNKKRKFSYKEMLFDVHPVSEIINYLSDAIIYITSSKYYKEIYHLIEEIPGLDEIEVFFHNYVRHTPIPYTFTTRYESIRIPKVIHYCWFGGKEIPQLNKKWMESWKKNCPDYEIIRWDETNYDYRKNKFISDAYDSGKWAFVSDYARMDILYRHGGVYLDNDVEIFKSLDPLLCNNAFCGTYYTSMGVAFGLGVGAVKGFNLLKEMCEVYERISFGDISEELEKHDCLKYQTPVLEKYGYKKELNTQQSVAGMEIYPTDVLAPMDLDGILLSKTHNTFAMHHFDASWQSDAEIDRLHSSMIDSRRFAEEMLGIHS